MRPDRSVIVYAQRVREAFADAAIVIGGIEASLRRIAHYDYWQEKVRRSILLDARADLLVFGNGERQIVEIAHRLAAGEHAERDSRRARHRVARHGGRRRLDRDRLDASRHAGPVEQAPRSLRDGARDRGRRAREALRRSPAFTSCASRAASRRADRDTSYIRLPSYEQVRDDPVLYAHASRILHMESNPGNARALVQRHGASDVWLNPPPVPLYERRDGRASTSCRTRACRIRPTATRRSRRTR